MADEKPSLGLLGEMPAADPLAIQAMQERQTETLHYAAIGRVAASWSYFEAMIDSATVSLTNLNGRDGVCFTAQIFGPGRKLDAFIALAREKGISDKTTGALNKFAKEVKDLALRRDRVIHDVWFFPHPDTPRRIEATAAKVLRLEHVPETTEKLTKLHSRIEALRHRFIGFLRQIHVELHPSPGTSP